MADNLAHTDNRRQVVTIDDLPDDVLLEIFDFYVFKFKYRDLGLRQEGGVSSWKKIESWQSLVHVCRRWRCLVFASPHRLNLQLYYIPLTGKSKSLDVWPVIPLLIFGISGVYRTVDPVVALLKHSNRIRQIELAFRWNNYPTSTTSEVEKLWTAMEVPFPELAALYLSFPPALCGPVLPDSFLGGSTPRLRYFYLHSIPFPGLPKLLLSATHLVKLRLLNIPHSGYISPEAMVTCLSVLTSLEELRLEFKSPYPDLKSRLPFPLTRSVLPALTNFWFGGLNEYLEEFVAQINAPELSSTTLSDNIHLDTPELSQFISRTPTFGEYNEAHFNFYRRQAEVRLRQSHPGPFNHSMVKVKILGNWQISSLSKICTLSLRLLLTMENLYIDGNQYSPPVWENTEWLDLLLPFTAVRNLYLSKQFSPPVVRALQELTGESTTEVLPALQNVLLEGFRPSESVQEDIARFISARQFTNHPVTISAWDGNLA